jgi:hypothetical protein
MRAGEIRKARKLNAQYRFDDRRSVKFWGKTWHVAVFADSNSGYQILAF